MWEIKGNGQRWTEKRRNGVGLVLRERETLSGENFDGKKLDNQRGSSLDDNPYNLYHSYMNKQYTTSTARAEFADIVSRAEYAGERTIVHRRKRPVAAVVPIEDLECLRRLEDEIDIAAARKAMREKGKNISWSEIKKEFKY